MQARTNHEALSEHEVAGGRHIQIENTVIIIHCEGRRESSLLSRTILRTLAEYYSFTTAKFVFHCTVLLALTQNATLANIVDSVVPES